MSSIMDLIGLELFDQPVPNLATIYMPIKSQMSSILGQIKSDYPELFSLEFGKIAESDFVYTPALFTLQHLQILTNQHQTWSKYM